MPKIPGQTSPTVAPQPINLPGPGRTSAGQGLMALSRGLQDVAQVVGQKEAEADEEMASKQEFAFRTKLNEYRLSEQTGYERWVGKDAAGNATRVGVTDAYMQRAAKDRDDLGAGLSERARQRFNAKADALLLGFDSELQKFEAGELKKERVGIEAAGFEVAKNEAAGMAQRLDAETEIPANRVEAVTRLAGGHAAAIKHAERMADIQGLLPGGTNPDGTPRIGQREIFIQEMGAQYHATVLNYLLANGKISKEVAADYLDLVVKTDQAMAKNATFLKATTEVTAQTRAAAADREARSLLAKHAGNLPAARGEWSEKVRASKDAALNGISSAVEQRLNTLANEEQHAAQIREEPMTLKAIGRMMADVTEGRRPPQRAEQALAVYSGGRLTYGTGLPTDAKSEKMWQTFAAAHQQQYFVAAPDSRPVKPTGEDAEFASSYGRELNKLIKNMPAQDAAKFADPNHPLYDDDIPAQDAYRVQQTARLVGVNHLTKARAKVADDLKARTRAQAEAAFPKQANRIKRYEAAVEQAFRDWAAGKPDDQMPTDKEVSAIYASAWEIMDAFPTNTPRAMLDADQRTGRRVDAEDTAEEFARLGIKPEVTAAAILAEAFPASMRARFAGKEVWFNKTGDRFEVDPKDPEALERAGWQLVTFSK